jgi:hypothetical protein
LGEDSARQFAIVGNAFLFTALGRYRSEIASEEVDMTQYAEVELCKDEVSVGTRTERRMKLVRTLLIAEIVGMVGLALIAEARLPPEQRVELFEPLAYAYP